MRVLPGEVDERGHQGGDRHQRQHAGEKEGQRARVNDRGEAPGGRDHLQRGERQQCQDDDEEDRTATPHG